MPAGTEQVAHLAAFEEQGFLTLVDNKLAAEYQFLAGKLPDKDVIRQRVFFSSLPLNPNDQQDGHILH